MKMAISAGASYNLLTLPTKYRPPVQVYGNFENTSANYQYIRIETNGNMIFYTSTAISGDAHNCAFSFSYIVE
jgi:hypothetical protein